ncbi:Gfo/Idh/MocA family oxidoreductase [Kineococcus rubinsiae]|uniref:Gfo/Idh/MocA family oxidoreductase n=1 Tax=Kineococcus rubinsiae TaxID=2609562 RepID=UPI0014311A25|nr:Gfo/Idh/MocA family oxidoreductase [Kineococcus rubinsiae]NIZ92516.1 gfo/Idh/MocA family oxidoreductase [Kineococcus rubinsiae]
MSTPAASAAPVRTAVVGYGAGGRFFHAPVVAGAAGCELVAVVTRSPERAELARAEHGVPVVGALEDLPALGVEAVAISTPAATHTALTEQALRLGLATVCDKPFALDAEAARGTVALAAELGVLLSVYQNRRFDADLLTLRRVLDEGGLGRVQRFESSFERWAAGDPPEAGAGLLRDFGSHLVDQALLLFGPVATVSAQTLGADGAEHDVRLQLQHAVGVRTEVSGSWKQAAPAPRFRVTGTAGTFVLDTPMEVQEELLLAGRTPAAEGEAWGAEPAHRWGRLHVAGGPVLPVRSENGRWPLFYERFAAAVRGTGPVPVEPADAVVTATVLDAARTSAAEGRTVVLG